MTTTESRVTGKMLSAASEAYDANTSYSICDQKALMAAIEAVLSTLPVASQALVEALKCVDALRSLADAGVLDCEPEEKDARVKSRSYDVLLDAEEAIRKGGQG